MSVDFDLVPELLQIAAAGDGSREGVTSDWSVRLERDGFTDADIDPGDGPGGMCSASISVARQSG